MEKIKSLFNQYKEIVMYLIMGVLTTIINLSVYYLLTATVLDPNIGLHLQIANVLSWIITITVAFITNKKYVFKKSNKSVIEELFLFVSSRVTTLLVNMFLMFLFVTVLKYNDKIVILFVQVIVIVLNYVLSKLVVFRKEKTKKLEKCHMCYIIASVMTVIIIIVFVKFPYIFLMDPMLYVSLAITYIFAILSIFTIGKSLSKKK